MEIKFNPTGTHVYKGFLKVRVDVYPEPTDKTYSIHHIQVPVIPDEGYQGQVDTDGMPVNQADYDGWIDRLPKVWQLNPCLCHFVSIDPDTSKGLLAQIVKGIFTREILIQLDDALSKFDTPKVGEIMRNKVGSGKSVAPPVDIPKLNARFEGLEVKV